MCRSVSWEVWMIIITLSNPNTTKKNKLAKWNKMIIRNLTKKIKNFSKGFKRVILRRRIVKIELLIGWRSIMRNLLKMMKIFRICLRNLKGFGQRIKKMLLRARKFKQLNDWHFVIMIGWISMLRILCFCSHLSNLPQVPFSQFQSIILKLEKRKWKKKNSKVPKESGIKNKRKMKSKIKRKINMLRKTPLERMSMKKMLLIIKNWENMKRKDLNTSTLLCNAIMPKLLIRFIASVMETNSRIPIYCLICDSSQMI